MDMERQTHRHMDMLMAMLGTRSMSEVTVQCCSIIKQAVHFPFSFLPLQYWYVLRFTVTDDCVMFYECHYAPCTKTEQHMQQFNVCGHCQSARLVC